MPLRQSQDRHPRPPLVRLGTIRGMGVVARNLAIARKAVEEIKSIEDELISQGRENREVFRKKMEWTASVAKSAGKSASDAAEILRAIRADVDKYLRDEKNGTD